MPEHLIEHMKEGYAGSGLSKEDVAHRVYGHLNKTGDMHGSKMTAKGARTERKYDKDRGVKISSKEAAELLAARK